jgi:hypothetical protein
MIIYPPKIRNRTLLIRRISVQVSEEGTKIFSIKQSLILIIRMGLEEADLLTLELEGMKPLNIRVLLVQKMEPDGIHRPRQSTLLALVLLVNS